MKPVRHDPRALVELARNSLVMVEDQLRASGPRTRNKRLRWNVAGILLRIARERRRLTKCLEEWPVEGG